jgi:hypothetical protein
VAELRGLTVREVLGLEKAPAVSEAPAEEAPAEQAPAEEETPA